MTAILEAPALTLTAEIVTVTPQMAREMLEYNTHNRKPRDSKVAQLARDIQRGAWVTNGEAIKRAVDGTILDGQHRLMAVVAANASITTLLIDNLPNEAQESMDTGIKRTFPDVLKLRGETDVNNIAALVLRIGMYEKGSLRLAASGKGGAMTNSELFEVLGRHPEAREISRYTGRIYSSIRIPRAAYGLLVHIFTEINTDDATWFFNKLRTGEMLAADHPVSALRACLINAQNPKSRPSDVYLTALAVKAWNKYRAGETATFLKFSPGGAVPERFPEPK